VVFVFVELTGAYSHRSATTGSTFVARRAGMTAAAVAVATAALIMRLS
jgi:hypothetical protein